MNWSAVHSAVRRDETARLPFYVGPHRAGSVARQHLPALCDWPDWLQLRDTAVVLACDHATAALTEINAALRDRGLVRGWRFETCAITALDSGQVVAKTERAASRFWGTLTLGVHATGYVAGSGGTATHLWLATRALNKTTDPGLLDNLVGGGVPHGQTPWQALVREAWEEAGLPAAVVGAATPGRVIRLHRDVPEGRQLEDLYSFDLRLPPDLQPNNQDGEVAHFECVPVRQALALAASEQMTVDASLVTLDFALRHRWCAAPAGAAQLMRGG